MDKIFQQDLTKEEKVGGIFIRAEALIPAVPLPPRMAVVPRSSNVVAEPQLAVKTIHGCIVLTNALRRNKGY